MNFIGIGGARHDTSIAALIDGEFKYRKSERSFGIKHHAADGKWYKSVLDDWGIKENDSKIVYTDSGKKVKLRLYGNVCNLSCYMCRIKDSSSRIKQTEKLMQIDPKFGARCLGRE